MKDVIFTMDMPVHLLWVLFQTIFKSVHAFCLLLGAITNIPTSVFITTPSVFQFFTLDPLYELRAYFLCWCMGWICYKWCGVSYWMWVECRCVVRQSKKRQKLAEEAKGSSKKAKMTIEDIDEDDDDDDTDAEVY